MCGADSEYLRKEWVMKIHQTSVCNAAVAGLLRDVTFNHAKYVARKQ